MIEDAAGRVEYDDRGGDGPTLVFVPGSCSTGAAWRPVIRSHGRPLPLGDQKPARLRLPPFAPRAAPLPND
jgi:hypothetical protein